jgi:hypothetical protein
MMNSSVSHGRAGSPGRPPSRKGTRPVSWRAYDRAAQTRPAPGTAWRVTQATGTAGL